MLDFGWSQMMLIAAVALIVLGPKELPRVIKTVTEWAGKARGLAREFRASVDEMVRESDLKNIKEEFEREASKAESEFRNTIDATATPVDPKMSENVPAADLPDYYGTADWNPEPEPQPLMDHQRRKKPTKRAARPVYKMRLAGAPRPGQGPPGARRKARP